MMPSDVCQVLSSVTILCMERGAINSHYASTFMYLLIESHTVVVLILAKLLISPPYTLPFPELSELGVSKLSLTLLIGVLYILLSVALRTSCKVLEDFIKELSWLKRLWNTIMEDTPMKEFGRGVG